jgi:hypothetical protein
VFAFEKVSVLGEIRECKNVQVLVKMPKGASDTNVKVSAKVESK